MHSGSSNVDFDFVIVRVFVIVVFVSLLIFESKVEHGILFCVLVLVIGLFMSVFSFDKFDKFDEMDKLDEFDEDEFDSLEFVDELTK